MLWAACIAQAAGWNPGGGGRWQEQVGFLEGVTLRARVSPASLRELEVRKSLGWKLVHKNTEKKHKGVQIWYVGRIGRGTQPS